MAASSSLLSRGLGLVLVEFQYEYEGRDGELISIKPNERYTLLAKTNDHWWQVRSDGNSKPFYIPAKYVKELPSTLPSPLDFADPPAPEPAPLPAAAPVPVPIPVPVPVPKAFEDTKPKAGDEVMIRLRPDSSTRHHKNENRMSTFGVPLDSYDLTSSRYPNNTPAAPTETGIPLTNEAASMTEGTRQLLGLLENHRDSGNARVPSFSPADPIPAPRTLTQPIPVDMPVVPPHGKLLNASSSSATDPHDGEEIPIEPDEEEELEEEILQEEPSSEESMGSAEEEEVLQEEDHHHHHHHIYESIQDLNLDLDALIGDKAIPAAPTEPAPSPPTTQSSLGHNSPIYANVSFVKKTSPPNTAGSDLPSQPPEDPAPSGTGHTPSPSGSSSGALSPASPVSPPVGWQTHTDQDSGKVFYYHPLTRQTTWSAPRSPPSSSSGQMDQSGVEEGIPLSPLVIPPSPQESAWEQLVEEASGRFYYYNRKNGATSWTPPELLATSPPGSTTSAKSEDGPPPLPKADYPVSDHSDNDSVFTVPLAGLIPRAHLDLKDPNSSQSKQQEFLNLPQRMVGNGVPEEGALQPAKPWRHSVAEDTFSASHHRNLSDLTDMNRRNSPDSPQCHMLEKAGILNKTKVADNGKKIRKNWSQSWTVLHGGILTFHKDPKSAPTGNVSKASQIVPEYTVELRGSSVGWASKDKSSKKHVLELKTRQGCEYLMQYDTESIICDWLKVIQDTIKQLEEDHISDDEEDVSDKEDKDRKRTSNRGSSGPESEQSRVRTKLRRFLQRRPTLQSVKEKGYIRDNVFGCHLDTLCHRENSTIPKFVEKCIRTVERRGLDVDGIYRVSGNLAVIQKLRHKADHEEQLDLEDGQWEEIHVVTGALKLFLRELPEPLFPFSCFDKFIAAIQIPDHSLKVSYMKDLVQTLPLPNHDTMELLFRHLRKVIDHKESNRMSFQSVAIVFGPTLLRPQTESPNMTIHMVFQSQIVELILKEFPTIFSQR
ncbi:rho GTPase-activating protein 27-like isoform X2 [Salarias fasciatus]|uniref:Rho GTPase-activating protein 27-like n=1 Tax=Salarias fasciatus TaxID=181472 RepID=A0A672H1B7_SALFA|nr:rho GTPase-activating protein 27-like isoform X2 [Salarias fasciatus]